MEERYAKEGMKTALGLLGQGQMALTKCLVLVDAGVNVRDVHAVLRAIRDHFQPAEDFLLLPGVPFDTLDFTSLTLNLGSKMVLDAMSHGATQPPVAAQVAESAIPSLDSRIVRTRVIEDALLLVQVRGEGRPIVEMLVKRPDLQRLRMIAAVSEDVDLQDRESWMWGLFTRFDPARDVVFSEVALHGSWPVARGVLGIDATFSQWFLLTEEDSPRRILTISIEEL